VFFPVYSQLFYLNPEKLMLRFFSSFKIIMTSIIILTILIHFYAQEIVLLLFGESYIPSIKILKYLIIATLLLYANTFISAFYNAIGFEKKVFFSTLIAAMSNVVLNSLLIPSYQAVGAIVGTIISLSVATGFFLLQFRKAVSKVSENVALKK
jgi:O-antigen/teichoic acid export membrane protein